MIKLLDILNELEINNPVWKIKVKLMDYNIIYLYKKDNIFISSNVFENDMGDNDHISGKIFSKGIYIYPWYSEKWIEKLDILYNSLKRFHSERKSFQGHPAIWIPIKYVEIIK